MGILWKVVILYGIVHVFCTRTVGHLHWKCPVDDNRLHCDSLKELCTFLSHRQNNTDYGTINIGDVNTQIKHLQNTSCHCLKMVLPSYNNGVIVSNHTLNNNTDSTNIGNENAWHASNLKVNLTIRPLLVIDELFEIVLHHVHDTRCQHKANPVSKPQCRPQDNGSGEPVIHVSPSRLKIYNDSSRNDGNATSSPNSGNVTVYNNSTPTMKPHASYHNLKNTRGTGPTLYNNTRKTRVDMILNDTLRLVTLLLHSIQAYTQNHMEFKEDYSRMMLHTTETNGCATNLHSIVISLENILDQNEVLGDPDRNQEDLIRSTIKCLVDDKRSIEEYNESGVICFPVTSMFLWVGIMLVIYITVCISEVIFMAYVQSKFKR